MGEKKEKSRLKSFLEFETEIKTGKENMEKAKSNLTQLEKKLFESMEFCLGILGTVPIPIFIVKGNEAIKLNSPASDNEKYRCAHCENRHLPDTWVIDENKDQCIFCHTVTEAKKTDQKVTKRGIWHVIHGEKECEIVVIIHAVSVRIEGESLVFTAVEDITEIERLKGLLPICMQCSKIYDKNSNAWVRIDEYITENSPARFSHGLCPVCSDELMDDME